MQRRKGLDKPVFLIATIALAIMFMALYFGAVSGWIDQIISDFTSGVNKVGTE